MIDRLGAAGLVGAALSLAGIAVVTYVNLLLGAGLALMFAGLGLVVYGLVTNLLASFGLGGGLP